MPAPEVGPQRFGKVDFRVRDLPEQEIADAHLAARANQQVRIGQTARIQVLLNLWFIDILRLQFALLSVPNQSSDRIDNLSAPSVTKRHSQLKLLHARGFLFGRSHPL